MQQNFLVYIFNKTFLERVYSKVWGRAILLPFLKPNKNPKSVDSYRPIALTSCLYILLEKIENIWLTFYLEQHNILSRSQLRFRKMRSTVDAIAKLKTDIMGAYSRKKHLVAVFFYMKKLTILLGSIKYCKIYMSVE